MQRFWEVVTRTLSGILFFVCLFCSQSEAAKLRVRHLARDLLELNSLSDWAIQTTLLTIAYSFSYLGTASVIEYTNPAPKDPQRIKAIKREIRLGILAMIINIGTATTWMWLIDPHTPYYGYYVHHPFTLQHFLVSTAIYFFITDAWFYWTHRWLHTKWAWKRIHYLHHTMLKPTAFAQDAVHPVEGTIQGPCGHHLAQLIYPIHPVMAAVYGFFTSTFAVAAHDGRPLLDPNGHYKHHTHKHVNYGLYFPLWDYICGTRYNPATQLWGRAYDTLEEEIAERAKKSVSVKKSS